MASWKKKLFKKTLKKSQRKLDLENKDEKIKQLKTKLKELEDVKLKDALAKYGEAYQDSGGAWQENAAWELADEEISVLRAMITEVKKGKQRLSKKFIITNDQLQIGSAINFTDSANNRPQKTSAIAALQIINKDTSHRQTATTRRRAA